MAPAVSTLARVELDRATIASCRRLQQQVFSPNPDWDGTASTEQFNAVLDESTLISGPELEAEVDFVLSETGPTDERWHIIRDEDRGVIAKAHTFAAAVETPAGPQTVLALCGVNVHPAHRKDGLGMLVVSAAFAQLGLIPGVDICIFQTGSAVPFYESTFGCKEISKSDIFLNGTAGELAFTDSFVLAYPGTASWPTAGQPVDARGYTGSFAWWNQETSPAANPPPRADDGLAFARHWLRSNGSVVLDYEGRLFLSLWRLRSGSVALGAP